MFKGGGAGHIIAMLEVTAKLPREIQQFGVRGASVLLALEATIVQVSVITPDHHIAHIYQKLEYRAQLEGILGKREFLMLQVV